MDLAQSVAVGIMPSNYGLVEGINYAFFQIFVVYRAAGFYSPSVLVLVAEES